MKRTKAIELLDNAKIPYQLKEFDAEKFTAQEAAAKLGIAIDVVYKTLVCKGQKGEAVMAVVPAQKELNLKKLANILGEKRCELTSLTDMQRLTGYLKGGCSPLGSKKIMRVFIDQSAKNQGQICVSAGLRGLQMLIDANDLLAMAKARFEDLCL